METLGLMIGGFIVFRVVEWAVRDGRFIAIDAWQRMHNARPADEQVRMKDGVWYEAVPNITVKDCKFWQGHTGLLKTSNPGAKGWGARAK